MPDAAEQKRPNDDRPNHGRKGRTAVVGSGTPTAKEMRAGDLIRALIPDIVPHLGALSPASSQHLPTSDSSRLSQDLSAFMQSTLEKFSDVPSLESVDRRHALIEMLIRDLERVAAVDTARSATAQCIGNKF